MRWTEFDECERIRSPGGPSSITAESLPTGFGHAGRAVPPPHNHRVRRRPQLSAYPTRAHEKSFNRLG